MECVERIERIEVPNPRLYVSVRVVLSSTRLGVSSSAHRLAVEKLVVQFGIQPVLDAFDAGLSSAFISDERRMCVLTALQFVTVIYGSNRPSRYSAQLQTLISPDRLALSIEAFTMGVFSSVHANRADLAVQALVKHFEWLKSNGVEEAGLLNISAAYTCEQFGHYDMALQFSFLGHRSAFHAEDDFAINLANFFVLNSTRLAAGSNFSLRSMYDQEILKQESGRLDLGVHLNYLLPVYAASQEVLSVKPDCKRIERLLAQASEIDNAVDNNCRLSWDVTNGCLQLLRGQYSQAITSLEQSELYRVRVDAAAEPLRQMLRRGVGLQNTAKALLWTPASTRAWKALQRCADALHPQHR